MWTVRIDGNRTVTCATEQAGLTSYLRAQRYLTRGHLVELWLANRKVLPAMTTQRR